MVMLRLAVLLFGASLPAVAQVTPVADTARLTPTTAPLLYQGATPPAFSQSVADNGPAVMPPALWLRLTTQGFSNITVLRRRGPSLLCEATGARRQRVRLVIDLSSGEITGLKVIGYDPPPPPPTRP